MPPGDHPRCSLDGRLSLATGTCYHDGDHPHDVEFARSVGARGIYVRTGHGEKHLGELHADEVVAGIEEAADWTLRSEYRL